MIKKVKNFAEALDAIEEIDKTISQLLDSDNNYGEVMKYMQKRLVYVAEISRLKLSNKVNDEINARIQQIFDSADSVQQKVIKKRDKIQARLDKNQKLINKNKKLHY